MSQDSRCFSSFGQRLRYWRLRVGLSQLELAEQSGTTPRHLSFLETGRSRPRRELVIRLAVALDAIRERNALLVAAGLPNSYPSHALTEDVMRPIRMVLDKVLHAHEPYPAWVVSSGLHFLSSNRAAEALFPGMCSMSPEAIVDMWFGPGPLRQVIENWQDVVWAGIAGLRREAASSSDPELFELLRRAEEHARHIPPPEDRDLSAFPVVCPRFKIGDFTLRTISTVMRFDTAIEETASQLRVELMFPADEESDSFFKTAQNSLMDLAFS